MNNEINVDVKTLRPLTRFIYTIGVLPTSYLMSMTYEEQLIWLCNYLSQTVIPTINNNGEAVKELQELYKELKDYVDNFIDTLDIQTEVDNKLEEMYESGQLAEIIAQFLEYAGVFGFDTKADLKAGTSFVNGSIAMTLGETTYNDGKINFYRIRNYLTTDVIDDYNILAITSDPSLIAEKIHNYYLLELYNKALENKENIENNKIYSLGDNVQALFYKELTGLFDYDDYSISSVIITKINNVNKGIAVANDWSSGGSGGTKFNIVTFDFIDENITNITTRASLVNGHANSMCEIGNNKVLICANGYNYIYNLVDNTYTLVTNELPYFSAVGNDSEGNIYAAQPYDNVTAEPINKLYLLDVDNENDTISVEEIKTLEDYNDKIGGGSQGMVIYNDLLIFPSYSPCKLCIYDLKTLKYLKTQLFTTPYLLEYEDGFIYNDELILCDRRGKLVIPDIYYKNCIGDYYHNVVTKSLTDIYLSNGVIKMAPNETKVINFEEHMSFGSADTGDTGVLGKQLESITLYMALRTSPTSEGLHNLMPVEIPLYQNITYDGDTISWYAVHWSTYYVEMSGTTGITRKTISGIVTFSGGDTIPSLNLKLHNYLMDESFSISNNTQAVQFYNETAQPMDLYITKIIGHRKVGLGY